jgi:hypothetical protein
VTVRGHEKQLPLPAKTPDLDPLCSLSLMLYAVSPPFVPGFLPFTSLYHRPTPFPNRALLWDWRAVSWFVFFIAGELNTVDALLE